MIDAIMPRKCVACDSWRAESATTAVVIGPETFYACDECVTGAEGPGRFQAAGDIPTALVLEALDQMGMADHSLSDEWEGYVAVFDRWTLSIDGRGFIDVLQHRNPEAAMQWVNGMEDDGFGADENDAYVSGDGCRGFGVSFAGKHIGNYPTERRARAAVSLEMRRTGYYPNVYLSGEHGPGVRRIDVW